MYRKLAALARRMMPAAVIAAAVVATASAVPVGLASVANATPPPGTTMACNYFYEWLGKVRFPAQADPHAAYSYVAVSEQAASDGIGFLVQGDFVHAAWTSWMVYGKGAKPFSVANFVNNPPANSNNPIMPNAGSIDPFTKGQPMLGTPRKFTLLFTPDRYSGPIATTLAGVPTAGIPAQNIKPYPRRGNFWALANRDYAAFPGYNPGGTTQDTFPTVTAVNLATGQAVDCQAYNLIPDRLQTPPTDPPSALNYGNVPIRIVLKNGSVFTGVDVATHTHLSEFSPVNPKGLVLFTRPPVAPGADVATVPPPDNCSGYLGSSLDPKVISLIRIPHIANYSDAARVTADSTYPNKVDPHLPWQAAYESMVQYGASSGLYLPGDPNTTALADHQFKVDKTGGSTIVVWPRNLSRANQRQVFAYAASQRWALLRGGTRGPLTGANMLLRVKAPASNYYGSLTEVPCFYGKNPHHTRHKRVPWMHVPIGTRHHPSQWVATAVTMGKQTRHGVISAAPQGVTCHSAADLASGKCLARLKRYITSTGGSYYAPPQP